MMNFDNMTSDEIGQMMQRDIERAGGVIADMLRQPEYADLRERLANSDDSYTFFHGFNDDQWARWEVIRRASDPDNQFNGAVQAGALWIAQRILTAADDGGGS